MQIVKDLMPNILILINFLNEKLGIGFVLITLILPWIGFEYWKNGTRKIRLLGICFLMSSIVLTICLTARNFDNWIVKLDVFPVNVELKYASLLLAVYIFLLILMRFTVSKGKLFMKMSLFLGVVGVWLFFTFLSTMPEW